MQHQEVDPHEALRDVIKCFWHNSRDFGDRQASFEVVPDGYVELIFYFGDACSLSTESGLQPLPSPFLTGLLNHPVRFYTKNRLDIIGVRCFPWTVFDLLGLPSGGKGVRLIEHSIARLQPALSQYVRAGRMEAALAQLTTYFLQVRAGLVSDHLLLKAGVAMREANGTLPVSEVAAAAHVTVRTLERKFKQAAGHTVKDVSGLIRFEQVRNQLWIHPDAVIAGLAHDLGYVDQAHLSRGFKRYSGTTPAAFARKAKREQRATGTDFVAFVQA